jgi:hypothetical protein
LRAEDVLQIEDIWCMKLDPEAGSLKTSGSERIIPLHPALIENGFLKFVATIKSGPLFAALSPDKFGKCGGNGTKVIGRFVRQLGLTDTRLSPSHSWRHRIKTLGRKFALAPDILDAICAATISWSLLPLWRTVSTPSKRCVLVGTATRLIRLFLALAPHGLAQRVLRFEIQGRPLTHYPRAGCSSLSCERRLRYCCHQGLEQTSHNTPEDSRLPSSVSPADHCSVRRH